MVHLVREISVLLERSLEVGPRTSGNCSLRCAVFVQGHTAECENQSLPWRLLQAHFFFLANVKTRLKTPGQTLRYPHADLRHSLADRKQRGFVVIGISDEGVAPNKNSCNNFR